MRDRHRKDCGERANAGSLDVKSPGKEERKLRSGTRNPTGKARKQPLKTDFLIKSLLIRTHCSSSSAGCADWLPDFPLPPPLVFAFRFGVGADVAAVLLAAAAESVDALPPVISLLRVEITSISFRYCRAMVIHFCEAVGAKARGWAPAAMDLPVNKL